MIVWIFTNFLMQIELKNIKEKAFGTIYIWHQHKKQTNKQTQGFIWYKYMCIIKHKGIVCACV